MLIPSMLIQFLLFNILIFTCYSFIIPNFKEIIHKNEHCKKYYEMNSVYDNISFQDYLEYWWINENNDTDDIVLENICEDIYKKYPIKHKHIRTKARN